MELSLALNTPGFVNKLREFLRRNSKSLNPSSKKEVLEILSLPHRYGNFLKDFLLDPKYVRTDNDIHQAVRDWCCNPNSAIVKYGHISEWDVSEVTNMTELFMNCSFFNDDISNWDVSNVTNMTRIFCYTTIFNHPIGNWNVSNVTNMEHMFLHAAFFDQPINTWNVSHVTNMKQMFDGAGSFNQPIDTWNVFNVLNMKLMFFNASRFNQPIGIWDVVNVIDMSNMFLNATSFNQSIGRWDVSNVLNMEYMFCRAENFNHPIDNWDVSKVTNIECMFDDCNIEEIKKPPSMRLAPLHRDDHNLRNTVFDNVSDVDRVCDATEHMTNTSTTNCTDAVKFP